MLEDDVEGLESEEVCLVGTEEDVSSDEEVELELESLEELELASVDEEEGGRAS